MNLKEKLYEQLQTLPFEELMMYVNEIEGGYIRANYHPEDNNLVILNYTELATFEKRWNKYTISARGLILDLTDVLNNGKIYILAKPFDKFPNYGLNEIEGYEDDIDFNQIDYIMEKMDGSLGISYFFKDEIRFATRGDFSSEQAIKATQIWKDKYESKNDMKAYVEAPITYLVEIIYPRNRVVVNYGNKEELVLLGVTFLFDGTSEPISYEYLEWEAKLLDMPIANQVHLSIEDMLDLRKKISANEEGWIVKFRNGKRLKIKGEEYINVHRIMYGLSDKSKVKAWMSGELEAYAMMLPEEFRPELEELEENLEKVKDSMYFLLQVNFEFIKNKYKTRKEFAIYVNKVIDKDYRKFMFKAFDTGSICVEMIREHIYKNYIEYLEVINQWGTEKNQDS